MNTSPNESATERGKRIIKALADIGVRAGLKIQAEYPVAGGRIDLVWLWHGPAAFPSTLPLVGFEVESSWRTRKHLKGDFLNLADLQPALGVIVLLGEGADVESTREFTRKMLDQRIGRFEVWSEADVLRLAQTESTTVAAELLMQSGAVQPEIEEPATSVSHTGKYRALAAWLAAQNRDQVDTTFSEIEEVIGFPLPPSCRKHKPHWLSYEGSAVARAIIDAGWVTTQLDLDEQHVKFERRP